MHCKWIKQGETSESKTFGKNWSFVDKGIWIKYEQDKDEPLCYVAFILPN